MKKQFLILLLAAALVLTGCRNGSPGATGSVPTEAAASAEAAASGQGAAGESASTETATEAASTEAAATEAASTEAAATEGASRLAQIPYRYASREEGRELLLANTEYFAGFSQNDLDYKCQQVGADMEAYLAFAGEQVMDFTPEEQALVDGILTDMEAALADRGYTLPRLDQVVLIKTTMEEELGAAGYTHGTQIYIHGPYLSLAATGDEAAVEYFRYFFWHELFHCLTRADRGFQGDMYRLIHFTTQAEDFPLPPCVFEYYISNPDVEHHNSWATFRIDGEDVDCFTAFVTTKHFEQPGEAFFDFSTVVLVPVDGRDVRYTPDRAENFDQVFGTNTGYVIDPEECMADNFAYAMIYGLQGPDGNGYPNPEIIAGILEYLTEG